MVRGDRFRWLLLALAVAVLAACSASPSNDLTGNWASEDYPCPAGVRHHETFSIVQTGTHVVATKVIGDDCVPSNHVTFEGSVDGHNGAVDIWLGAPGVTPAIGLRGAQLTVDDPSHFHVAVPGGSFTYVRTDKPGMLGTWVWWGLLLLVIAAVVVGALWWRRRRNAPVQG